MNMVDIDIRSLIALENVVQGEACINRDQKAVLP